jgi:hypothetical protein
MYVFIHIHTHIHILSICTHVFQIPARTLQQASMLLSTYIYIYIHLFISIHTHNVQIPARTLQEAAMFAVCRSSVWNAKLAGATAAWYVRVCVYLHKNVHTHVADVYTE